MTEIHKGRPGENLELFHGQCGPAWRLGSAQAGVHFTSLGSRTGSSGAPPCAASPSGEAYTAPDAISTLMPHRGPYMAGGRPPPVSDREERRLRKAAPAGLNNASDLLNAS